METLRHRKVNHLPKFTQLLSGRAKVQIPRVPMHSPHPHPPGQADTQPEGDTGAQESKPLPWSPAQPLRAPEHSDIGLRSDCDAILQLGLFYPTQPNSLCTCLSPTPACVLLKGPDLSSFLLWLYFPGQVMTSTNTAPYPINQTEVSLGPPWNGSLHCSKTLIAPLCLEVKVQVSLYNTQHQAWNGLGRCNAC